MATEPEVTTDNANMQCQHFYPWGTCSWPDCPGSEAKVNERLFSDGEADALADTVYSVVVGDRSPGEFAAFEKWYEEASLNPDASYEKCIAWAAWRGSTDALAARVVEGLDAEGRVRVVFTEAAGREVDKITITLKGHRILAAIAPAAGRLIDATEEMVEARSRVSRMASGRRWIAATVALRNLLDQLHAAASEHPSPIDDLLAFVSQLAEEP